MHEIARTVSEAFHHPPREPLTSTLIRDSDLTLGYRNEVDTRNTNLIFVKDGIYFTELLLQTLSPPEGLVRT